MEKKTRSEAQIKAENVYGEKRKSKHRLPGGYLNEEENDLLNRMAKHYTSKKEAIFEGLRMLETKLLTKKTK